METDDILFSTLPSNLRSGFGRAGIPAIPCLLPPNHLLFLPSIFSPLWGKRKPVSVTFGVVESSYLRRAEPFPQNRVLEACPPNARLMYHCVLCISAVFFGLRRNLFGSMVWSMGPAGYVPLGVSCTKKWSGKAIRNSCFCWSWSGLCRSRSSFCLGR